MTILDRMNPPRPKLNIGSLYRPRMQEDIMLCLDMKLDQRLVPFAWVIKFYNLATQKTEFIRWYSSLKEDHFEEICNV